MKSKQYYKNQKGEQVFYVYIHRRESDGKPFYVGKGKGIRAWRTDRNNDYWQNIFKKHGRNVDIVFDDLTEDEAFQVEIDTILELKYFGNKLANLTNGGEGPSGYVYSEDSRKKMSDAQKTSIKAAAARKLKADKKRGTKTGPMPKISKALKGKKKTEAHRKAAAEGLKDKDVYTFVRVSDGFVCNCTRHYLSEIYKVPLKSISTLFQKRKVIVAHGWAVSENDSERSVLQTLDRARNNKKVSEKTRLKMSDSRRSYLKDNPELMVRQVMSKDRQLRKVDIELHVFQNEDTGEVFEGTRSELASYINTTVSYVGKLFSQENPQRTVKKWKIKESGQEINLQINLGE